MLRLWTATASALAILVCTRGQDTSEGVPNVKEPTEVVSRVEVPSELVSLIQEHSELVIPFVEPPYRSNCPKGYDEIDYYCFKFDPRILEELSLLSYDEAKNLCRADATPGWKTDLVTLKRSEKLESLGRFIVTVLSSQQYYDFSEHWVGAEQIGEKWLWVDGDPVDLTSHIWKPGQPPSHLSDMRMILKPSEDILMRMYAEAYPSHNKAPSHICEAIKVSEGCPSNYTLHNGFCFRVLVQAPFEIIPFTYDEARRECLGDAVFGWRTDLVTLKYAQKLETLGNYIAEFPPYLYEYWVGGEQAEQVWKWVDGSPIDLKSNIWPPDEPLIDIPNLRMYLSPSRHYHKRLYGGARPSYSVAPSFICEAIQE